MTEDFSIDIGIHLDDSTLVDQLKKIQNKINSGENINLNLGLDPNMIRSIEQGVTTLVQKINTLENQIKPVNIINKGEIDYQINHSLKSIDEVKKALKELGMYNQGDIKINVKNINEKTKDIERFVATVKEANGMTKEFEFRPSKQIDDFNGVLSYKGRLQSIVDETDKAIKKLEKQRQKYQETINGFKNTGILGKDKINSVQSLLITELENLPIEKIKEKIKELSSEQSKLIKEAEKDSTKAKKIIDDQIKNLDKLEEKFHSLKFEPNRKQTDINNTRENLNNIKDRLSNSFNVDSNEIEGVIKKLNSLSNSWERVNQKDQKELKIRKELYEDIFDLQNKIAKQTTKVESLKIGDNSKKIAQDELDKLNKEFDEKKKLFNDKYYNKDVSKELKNNKGEIDFKLLEQKAKELDESTKKFNKSIDNIKQQYKQSLDMGKIDDIENKIKSLDPISKTLTQDIKSIENELNLTNSDFKEQINLINKERNAYDELIKLEKQRHEVQKKIINSNNQKEKDLLKVQELSLNNKIDSLQNNIPKKSNLNNIDKIEELNNIKELNKLQLQLIENKKKNKESTEEIAKIYQKLNKVEDNAYNIEKKLSSAVDNTLKNRLESELNLLKKYEQDLNDILNKNNFRDKHKDEMLNMKKNRHNIDLDYSKNSKSGNNNDLSKFIRTQENMLLGLQEKFRGVLKTNEIETYISALKSFNPATNTMVEDMEKVIQKHRQFKNELQERKRIDKFGEKIDGKVLDLNSDINDVERYMKSITNGKAHLTQFGGVINDNGNKLRQVHYTLEEGKNRFGKYTITIDGATKSIYKLNKGITDVSSSKLSLMDLFKGAFESVAGFTIVSGAVFGLISGLKDAIKYVADMDTALTELNKVVDLSKTQLESMREAALQLGNDLGKSSVDVMNAMAEAGRQFKNTEDIKEFSRVATMASNVTDMSGQQAAKSFTTVMRVFKQNIGDVKHDLDSFNEIQNNFRRVMRK